MRPDDAIYDEESSWLDCCDINGIDREDNLSSTTNAEYTGTEKKTNKLRVRVCFHVSDQNIHGLQEERTHNGSF